MAGVSDAIRVIEDWYANLRHFRDDLPSKGSISAALVVVNQLRIDFNLDIDAHVASGKAQIAGLSGPNIQAILAEFGVTRRLSSIGGRTNRGARGDVENLLSLLRTLDLDRLPTSRRNELLIAMQRHIVEKYVPPYFAVKRVKARFDPNLATWRLIQLILEEAKAGGKAGPVAEHLVGAKLALRFPKERVRNKPAASADMQSGYSGDFEIRTTAFHVTVAPMRELLEKCDENLQAGLRVYVLVPLALVVGTRQNADSLYPGRIAVESIESFVATNIDEFTEFDRGELKSGLYRLLEMYNCRVSEVELDQSILIEIPSNLK